MVVMGPGESNKDFVQHVMAPNLLEPTSTCMKSVSANGSGSSGTELPVASAATKMDSVSKNTSKSSNQVTAISSRKIHLSA